MSDTAPPGTVAGDLRQHLYRIYLNTAVDEMAHRWVMNREWFRECRKLDGGHDGGGETGAAYMLGLPVEVRDDGGPPHLER